MNEQVLQSRAKEYVDAVLPFQKAVAGIKNLKNLGSASEETLAELIRELSLEAFLDGIDFAHGEFTIEDLTNATGYNRTSTRTGYGMGQSRRKY